MTTRVIILAGGCGSRWSDHMGVPKHLVPVPYRCRTVPLLAYTVDALREWIGDVDVHVVRPAGDVRYEVVEGARFHESQWTPGSDGIEPWLSWKTLWSTTGRTLVLLGDVWFSPASFEILADDTDFLAYYARTGPSVVTGCPWGEDFGLSMYPQHRKLWSAALRCARAWGPTVGRAGSWEAAQVMCGASPTVPPNMDALRDGLGCFRTVEMPDDGTDDFDLPEDYDRWLNRR